MKKQQIIFIVLTLLLIVAAGGTLLQLRANQTLGAPGVQTRPLPDSQNLEVLLPEHVLDYSSTNIETDELVLKVLPADTSYGQRRYTAPDGFQVAASVVLMGSDRTSHHKPDYCLRGSGWQIDASQRFRETIPIDRPAPYELPVTRMVVNRMAQLADGRTAPVHGVYVYWFVADGALSGDPSGLERMWSMARNLVTTGVLQRWAYVTYFAVCEPGAEQATYERMKKLIVASVPELHTPSVATGALAGSE